MVDSADNQETEREEVEYCCVGLLEIYGTVLIDETIGATTKYSGTITVKTITKCDTEVKCEGKTWLNPFTYTTCDMRVEGFNREYSEVEIAGIGVEDDPIEFSFGAATKLGCCVKGCTDKVNVEVYEISGSAPRGQLRETIIYQVSDDYSFGGDVQKPKFKACCKKKKPADRGVK
jgi:hypothetical protein